MKVDAVLKKGAFRIMHRMVKERAAGAPLLEQLKGYAEAYLQDADLEPEAVLEAYQRFLSEYERDVRVFEESGKYPHELEGEVRSIPRHEYDMALILSTLVAPHRYRIMELVAGESRPAASALFVGLGSGLELELVKDRYEAVTGYDLSLHPFCRARHPEAELVEAEFTGQGRFQAAFLIELLEHLEDPGGLLDATAAALEPGGHLYLTTATDLPQFDHLYNFPRDHSAFEAALAGLGLEVDAKVEVPHETRGTSEPMNVFYRLRKRAAA